MSNDSYCKKLKKRFEAADTNGDGSLDFDEMVKYEMNVLEIPLGKEPEVRKEVEKRWDQLDTDHNGKISLKEAAAGTSCEQKGILSIINAKRVLNVLAR